MSEGIAKEDDSLPDFLEDLLNNEQTFVQNLQNQQHKDLENGVAKILNYKNSNSKEAEETEIKEQIYDKIIKLTPKDEVDKQPEIGDITQVVPDQLEVSQPDLHATVVEILSKSENDLVINQIIDNLADLVENDLVEYCDELLRTNGSFLSIAEMRTFQLVFLIKSQQTAQFPVKCLILGDQIIENLRSDLKVRVFGQFQRETFGLVLWEKLKNQAKSFLKNNFLVVEPQIFITPTKITSSRSCLRTPLIEEMFDGFEESKLAMLIGSVFHNSFEQSLKMYKESMKQTSQFATERIVQTFLSTCAEEYQKNIPSFYYLKYSRAQFEAEALEMSNIVRKWMKKNLEKEQFSFEPDSGTEITVLRLDTTEQMITCEKIGLKGKVDLLFFCRVKTEEEEYETFLPFELKTGKHHNYFYQIQTLYYSLLLMQKHDLKQNIYGILYYLKLDEQILVKPNNRNFFFLINRRNALAINSFNYNQSEDIIVPQMTKLAHDCKFCFVKESCFLLESIIQSDPQKIQVKRDSIPLFEKIFSSLDEDSRGYTKSFLYELQREQQFSIMQESSIDSLVLTMEKNVMGKFIIDVETMSSRSVNQQSQKMIEINLTQEYLDKGVLKAILEMLREGQSYVLEQSDLKIRFRGDLNQKLIQPTDQGFLISLRFYNYSSDINISELAVVSLKKNNSDLTWRVRRLCYENFS